MAVIKPFKGILYNRKKVDISRVVTPPYDVISPSMQSRFYKSDPHNIVRLILGKDEKTDSARRNRYTRARALLNRWLKEGLLVRERGNVLYVYAQQYLHKGEKKTRVGFIALMKIEDPKKSGILPHEYTLEKPKKDRLNLTENTKANLSPIFSLFQDKGNNVSRMLKKIVKRETPVFAFEAEGVVHRLWKVGERRVIEKIKRHMKDKKIFIADGHHRYEVALAYRNKMRHTKAFKKSMDYVMMYFSNLDERGNLTILSTHRVIRGIGDSGDKDITRKLKEYFYVTKVHDINKLFRQLDRKTGGRYVFGLYTRRKRFYLLTLKDTRSIEKLIGPAGSGRHSLKRLNVTVLHEFIINKILGVKVREGSIKYVRDERHALKLVDKGDYGAAFFLRPTSVLDMKAVAEKGEMMPQKSTYFYPKLLTGLVINIF